MHFEVMKMQEPDEIEDWRRKTALGSGGFGIVTLWENKISGDRIAVKKCRWSASTSLTQRQRERWKTEVALIEDIQHANIISHKPLPDILKETLLKYNPSDLPILSMEYCNQGNLRSVLNEPQNSCGLSESEALCVLTDICGALKYLHQFNITHRDVKPENIVLQTCNNRATATIYKLIDLGYAKELNTTCSFVGTLQYLAPEMMIEQSYDHKVDYWSFGICVFEIICGIRPFLPAMQPFLCIEAMKKKPSGIIYIQRNHLGALESGTEILKENYLNTNLKDNLEIWLKSALDFKPDKRTLGFGDLEQLLEKKIVKMFVIFTFQFYSYEIDDGTTISDLKEWIECDTNIKIEEQIVIGTNGLVFDHNKKIMLYCDQKNQEDNMFFVFKKNAAVSENIQLHLPATIQYVFNNKSGNFENGTIARLYAHMIYLIIDQNDYIGVLEKVVLKLNGWLKNKFALSRELFKKSESICKNISSVMDFINRIEKRLCMGAYKNIVGDKEAVCRYIEEYQKSLKNFNIIVANIKRFENILNHIGATLGNLQSKEGEIASVLDNYNTTPLLETTIEWFIKYESIKTQAKAEEKTIEVISQILKMRDSVLSNQLLNQFIIDFTNAYYQIDYVLNWFVTANNHLIVLKDQLQERYLNKLELIINSRGKKMIKSTGNIDHLHLIEECLNEVLLKCNINEDIHN